MIKDYHLTLGVTTTASREELETAYRRRALELHPDRFGTSWDPFLELQEAFGVLSDRRRRADHERRLRGVGGSPAEPFAQGAEPEADPRGDVPLFGGFASYGPSADEIQDRWRGNFGTPPRPKSEHLEGLTVELPLSQAQALRGGELVLRIPASVHCPGCGGSGAVGHYLCWRCGGNGQLFVAAPLRLTYPAGIRHQCVFRVPLEHFGIRNLYLTIRFRVSEAESV